MAPLSFLPLVSFRWRRRRGAPVDQSGQAGSASNATCPLGHITNTPQNGNGAAGGGDNHPNKAALNSAQLQPTVLSALVPAAAPAQVAADSPSKARDCGHRAPFASAEAYQRRLLATLAPSPLWSTARGSTEQKLRDDEAELVPSLLRKRRVCNKRSSLISRTLRRRI